MHHGWATACVRNTNTTQNIPTTVFPPTQYLLQTPTDFYFWFFYTVNRNLLTIICSSNIRHKRHWCRRLPSGLYRGLFAQIICNFITVSQKHFSLENSSSTAEMWMYSSYPFRASTHFLKQIHHFLFKLNRTFSILYILWKLERSTFTCNNRHLGSQLEQLEHIF